MTTSDPIINNEDSYDHHDNESMARRRLDVFLAGLIELLNKTDIEDRPMYSGPLIESLANIVSGEDPLKALGLVKANHRPSTEDRDMQIAYDYIAARKKGAVGKVIKSDLATEWDVRLSTIEQAIKKYRVRAEKKIQIYEEAKKRHGKEFSDLIDKDRESLLNAYTEKK